MNLPALTAAIALSTALGLSPHPASLASEATAEPIKQVQPVQTPVATETAMPAVPTAPIPYTVVSGDNLSRIAEAQKLSSWRQLWNANTDLTDPNMINVGQVLTVPAGDIADRPLPATTNVTALNAAPTYAAPTPASVKTTSIPVQAMATAEVAPSSNIDAVLAHVRKLESGGNYATNTGNGYYGAYQFNLGTWRGVGGTGLPSNASPAEQDMRAQMLYARRGCSPWPNTCY